MVYIFKESDKKWETIQTISTAGSSDNVGSLQVDLENNILLISATGTPLQPIPNETVNNQDFSGALLIYKLNRREGEGDQWWDLIQTLDRNTHGLEDLTLSSAGALNPNQLPTLFQQGAYFGLQAKYNQENRLLLVSAQYQQNKDASGNPIINSGAVYAFRMNRERGKFELIQKITNPDGPSSNDTFGANVRLHGNYALISNSPVLIGPRTSSNGAVYLYHYENKQWNFIQKLTGTQQAPTVVASTFGATTVGDGFGSSLALNDHWAIVGAGFESKGSGLPLSGAVYFYKFKHKPIGKYLEFKQKAFSDDPTVQGTALLHVDLLNNVVLVSDPLRSGPNGKFQGGALLFERTKDEWKQKKVLYDPQGKPNDFFGFSVALDRESAVVGSSPFGVLPLTKYGNPLLTIPLPLNSSKVIFFRK